MKTYIKPELEITNIKAQPMMIAISSSPASSTYEGGGDAKERESVDFSSEDAWK